MSITNTSLGDWVFSGSLLPRYLPLPPLRSLSSCSSGFTFPLGVSSASKLSRTLLGTQVLPPCIITVIMTDIRDYKICIPPAAIEETRQKLALAKFPDDAGTDGDAWECGVPVEDLKRITKYWQDEFKWASFEEQLNELPHFETTMSLDGFEPFELHFIHQKSSNPDAIPLLFVHGC